MSWFAVPIFALSVSGIYIKSFTSLEDCEKANKEYQGSCDLVDELEIPIQVVLPQPFCLANDPEDCYQYQGECQFIADSAGTQCTTHDLLTDWNYDAGKRQIDIEQLKTLLSHEISQ